MDNKQNIIYNLFLFSPKNMKFGYKMDEFSKYYAKWNKIDIKRQMLPLIWSIRMLEIQTQSRMTAARGWENTGIGNIDQSVQSFSFVDEKISRDGQW